MDTGRGTEKISRRELEVARAYTGGKTYREIADDLNIAPATVRTHINNIYRKLEVSSKIELLHQINSPPESSDLEENAPKRGAMVRLFTGGLSVLAAVVAILYMAPSSPTQTSLAPHLPELHTVALVAFRHDGDEVARDTVVGELVAGLTKHAELFVIRPARLSGNKLPEPHARFLSRSISERYVMFGQVASGQRGLVVSAALYDAREDKVIWRDEVQSAEQNSLAVRLDLLESLSKVVSLPAADEQAERCLEMLEYAGTDSTRPLYRYEVDAPVYCQVDTSGPR